MIFAQKTKRAFSVAEAMMALLIGSIALGAAAPMITKQMKQNNFSDVQQKVIKREQTQQQNEIRGLGQEVNDLFTQIEEIKASNNNSLPNGAVIPFYLTTCPEGWTPLSEIVQNTEGAFIRNIGGNALTMGSVQLDAAPNIEGTWVSSADSLNDGNQYRWTGAMFHRNLSVKVSNGPGDHDAAHYQVFFDASRSSAVYGRKEADGTAATEVRPKNIALLYCVKTAEEK